MPPPKTHYHDGRIRFCSSNRGHQDFFFQVNHYQQWVTQIGTLMFMEEEKRGVARPKDHFTSAIVINLLGLIQE